DDTVGIRNVALEVACHAAARRAEVLREVLTKRVRARRVEIMDDQLLDPEIHQRKGDGVYGSTGADLHHARTVRAIATEAFGKTVSPAWPIEIVAGGAAVRRNRDGVDRTGLHGRRVHGVEQWDDILFERIGDVGAGKARGFDRVEEFR